MNIPAKVSDRLSQGLKRMAPIALSAQSRDVNEADTVVVVMEILSEIFGYDKFSEITREHQIRGTYVDLAISLNGSLQLLIEVKAIGIELKDAHVKQAIDYAANKGIEWVILTNARIWKVFRVSFGKPIDYEQTVDLHLLDMNAKNKAHLESLFLLSREGMTRSVLEEHHNQQQATNRFILAAILLGDPCIDVVRRELRRMTPGLKIEPDEIRQAIQDEVFKREVIEGEKAVEAKKKVSKAQNRMLRQARKEAAHIDSDSPESNPTNEGMA